MTCNHCGKENRPEARYCRFCGEAMATADNMQQGLVGNVGQFVHDKVLLGLAL